MVIDGHEISVTSSVGIAWSVAADESADDLLRHADAAMYAAKELGRDRVEVFDDSLRSKVRRRLQDEIELRRALDQGELIVHYQPEVEVPSGRLLGVEALVRWDHPQDGMRSAAEFIDLAEETGLIVDIGLAVLREACLQQVRWERAHPEHPLLVRVNLSARQIGQRDLLTQVTTILQQTGIQPRPALLRDHRDHRDGRRRSLARGAREAPRRSGWSWPSTTSAPGTRRSATSSASRSTWSRSTARSSTASAPIPTTPPSCGRSWCWRARSAST